MKSYNFQLKFICISPRDLSKEMYFFFPNQESSLIFKNHLVKENEAYSGFELPKSIQLVLITDRGCRKHDNVELDHGKNISKYAYLGQSGYSINTFKINSILGFSGAQNRANLI